MGLIDTIFGDGANETQNTPTETSWPGVPPRTRPLNVDEQAVARYRYLLQNASPAQMEGAHAEAFSVLTPDQRQLAAYQLSLVSGTEETAEDTRSLAHTATVVEIENPGEIERLFGGANQIGGLSLAGSFLASLATAAVGSSVADSFFSDADNEEAFQGSLEAQSVKDGITDYLASDFRPESPTADSALTEENLEETKLYADEKSSRYTGKAFDGGGFEEADLVGDF